MAVNQQEFQSIVEYVQARIIQEIEEDGYDIMQRLSTLVKYEEWKASRVKRKKKVEGIPEEVVKQFEIFWQEYPGISRFQYKDKKFDGERVLKANKQVCLKLYNDCIHELYLTGPGNMSQYKAHEVLLKALQVQIANIKIESYKNGQNRMQYMKSCEVYLRQKAYEPWIGQEMPEEMKVEKVIENTIDM